MILNASTHNTPENGLLAMREGLERKARSAARTCSEKPAPLPTGLGTRPNNYCMQRNLRNRVASVTYEDADDADSLTYRFAAHYTYDVHGNVDTLVQENTRLHAIGHGYKRPCCSRCSERHLEQQIWRDFKSRLSTLPNAPR